MEGMDLTPLVSNLHKYDLVIISQIIQMIETDVFWHQKTFKSVLTDLQKMWMEGIHELENASMYCTENGEIDDEMDGVEVIDLCSVSQTKNDARGKGKESAKQESQDKMKTDATNRMEDENRPIKSKSTTKTEEVETMMMCWEAVNDFPEKEPCKESENEEEKLIEKMQKTKHEDEHVEPTLNIGNQLKILIEEFSWEREDDRSTLDTQETEQHQLVYIMNLKDGLQKSSMKLYNEKGPNNKKSAVENRFLEEPTLNNLNHVYELYEESGSDNKNIEDIVKGENKKNSREQSYTMNKDKEGKQADLLNKEKPRNHHDVPRKKGGNEKALVTKEMGLSNLGENIFIGDSAATSHMTSNKLGVYNLVPINGSVMIGNGQSFSCTHKGKWDVICKHKDEPMARETWDVTIVPQLNHDLFSFTKAMKEGWQMNRRWKEGGLVIELFKTTRASMKFDRMIPSGSSWLMGIKIQRVLDHAHSAMEPGKTISMSKLHQITGHTGEHLLRPTASYMKIKLTGKLAPCEVCAQAKIR